MKYHFKKKGKLSQKSLKTSSIHQKKQIIFDICGFAPYEKKIIEILKLGNEKKALKFGKKKMGNTIRSKRKKESLAIYIRKK
nr:60S ribosomal protein L36 [Cryptomonas curvata]